MSAVFAEAGTLISRHNAAVARSAGMALTGDGMVVVARPRSGLAFLVSVAGAVVLLTLAKAFLLVMMGPEAYDAALAALQDGALVDRIGALALGVDAATGALSALVG